MIYEGTWERQSPRTFGPELSRRTRLAGGTYKEVAELFDIGEASVGHRLRLDREIANVEAAATRWREATKVIAFSAFSSSPVL